MHVGPRRHHGYRLRDTRYRERIHAAGDQLAREQVPRKKHFGLPQSEFDY
jgi:hypothetical protein